MFGGGELEAGSPDTVLEFDYAFDMAGRLELYPSMMAQVSTIGVKPVGHRVTTVLPRETIEGNALPFSPAYNV